MSLTSNQETWIKNKIAVEKLERAKEGLIKTANEQKTIKSDEIVVIDTKLIQDLQVKNDAIMALKESK